MTFFVAATKKQVAVPTQTTCVEVVDRAECRTAVGPGGGVDEQHMAAFPGDLFGIADAACVHQPRMPVVAHLVLAIAARLPDTPHERDPSNGRRLPGMADVGSLSARNRGAAPSRVNAVTSYRLLE